MSGLFGAYRQAEPAAKAVRSAAGDMWGAMGNYANQPRFAPRPIPGFSNPGNVPAQGNPAATDGAGTGGAYNGPSVKELYEKGKDWWEKNAPSKDGLIGRLNTAIGNPGNTGATGNPMGDGNQLPPSNEITVQPQRLHDGGFHMTPPAAPAPWYANPGNVPPIDNPMGDPPVMPPGVQPYQDGGFHRGMPGAGGMIAGGSGGPAGGGGGTGNDQLIPLPPQRPAGLGGNGTGGLIATDPRGTGGLMAQDPTGNGGLFANAQYANSGMDSGNSIINTPQLDWKALFGG